MSTTTLLIAAVGVQAAVLALDLVDRHVTRKRRYGGESLRAPTALFLGLVLLTYFAVQYAGFALVPGADLLAMLRRAPEPRDGAAVWSLLLVVPVFYLSGLGDYLVHRFVSHHRWLWFTHDYHHLPNQVFVAMPGLAARPFAVLATFPVTLATIAMTDAIARVVGLPDGDLETLKILLLTQVALLTTSHSCCLRRWWWIHRALRTLALTTPHEHVLHHAAHLEGNYGNFTTLWDRVFGTYLDPALAKHRSPVLGLAYDQDFLGVLTARMIRLPRTLRSRFQVDRYCNLESVPRAR